MRVQEKLKQLGFKVEIKIVFENLSEIEAFELEKELIAKYGYEHLTNMTVGGEGPSGVVFSKETIAKRIESRKGYRHSSETIEKMSQTKLGRKKTEEHKEKLSQSLMGKKRSLESIQKQKQSTIGVKKSQFQIEQMKIGRMLAKKERDSLYA